MTKPIPDKASPLSSFSGLLTRFDIGHMRIGSAGHGRIKSCGSGLSLSQRMQSMGARMSGIRSWIFGNHLIGVRCDIAKVSYRESIRCFSLI